MRKFTLGLNATENTDYIEKYFKQKLRRIKFPKKPWGPQKFGVFEIYSTEMGEKLLHQSENLIE